MKKMASVPVIYHKRDNISTLGPAMDLPINCLNIKPLWCWGCNVKIVKIETRITDDYYYMDPCVTTSSAALLALQWRHDGFSGVSNHQPHHCLLSRLFGRRSKKTSKLRITGFCAGNSPGTGEFPAQRTSTAGNVSIWWRHHVTL